ALVRCLSGSLDCVLPGVHRHEESERLGSAIPDSYKDVDARSRQFRRPSINCPGGPECPTDPAVWVTQDESRVGGRWTSKSIWSHRTVNSRASAGTPGAKSELPRLSSPPPPEPPPVDRYSVPTSSTRMMNRFCILSL